MDSLATIPLLNPNAITTSGTYYLKSSAVNNCTSTKAVAVKVSISRPVIGVRYPTRTVQPNSSVQLIARNLGSNYTWNPPIGLSSPIVPNPIFNYDKQTEYTVTIKNDSGCVTVDTILVKVNALPGPIVPPDILLPKAWSPNGDGHNDKLIPLLVNMREIKYFRIFNRWGQLVYETNAVGQGWDGMFKGKPQVLDVYTWVAEGIGINGQVVKRAGNSVLIR
jgi:gliding motility-associated-like protein